MSLFRSWWFPVVAAVVFLGLFLAIYKQGMDVPTQPKWTPGGDPLITMDHHNALICGQRMRDAQPLLSDEYVQAHFCGRDSSGQQITMYPTKRGLCGELDMTRLGNAPVMIMLTPHRSEDWQGFTVTAWMPIQPTNVETSASYAWSTAAMTERRERWWTEFSFRSASEPVTTLTLGVE